MPHRRTDGFYMDFVMAGFGGQGILISGNLLCYAGLAEGREVTYFPSYGAEMRGGAANCFVVVSEKPIGSPIPSHPIAGMIMSLPALERFRNAIRPGGYMMINTDIVPEEEIRRDDVQKILVPANSISIETVGNERLANLVMLGCMANILKMVKVDSLISAITEVVSEKHKKMIPLNEKAIRAGAEYAAKLGHK